MAELKFQTSGRTLAKKVYSSPIPHTSDFGFHVPTKFLPHSSYLHRVTSRDRKEEETYLGPFVIKSSTIENNIIYMTYISY